MSEASESIKDKGKRQEVVISYEELEMAGAKTKSQIIRYLNSLGYERSAIAKFLNVKYQHVRNVLTQPLKRVIKAEREAAKLRSQHPSTLTERQRLLVVGSDISLSKTLSEDGLEEEEEDDKTKKIPTKHKRRH